MKWMLERQNKYIGPEKITYKAYNIKYKITK